MRVLLLHPEDSPRSGPWSSQRWDFVVDLGQSSQYSKQAWAEQLGCPVISADSFRHGVADAKLVRQFFSVGRGLLIDEEGIDWWDLTSLLLAPAALDALALQRIATELNDTAELWSTRPGWQASGLAILLGRPLMSFSTGRFVSLAVRARHYANLTRRFSLAQIKEIFLDKYDSGYRWRGHFAPKYPSSTVPVVLLPSAYGNVSRMAADYARMLPQQSFLMVATRQSARQFMPPPNVEIRDLATYARASSSTAESSNLIKRWTMLRSDLDRSPEWRVLSQTGILDPMSMWLRDGISVRDAWKEVIEHEPICSVLCGDDSNLFTRLSVLLAAKSKIPTADFHHGAFDGRYLLKDLPCDVYFAKNTMERDYLLRVCGVSNERVVLAAPATDQVPIAVRRDEREQRTVILFSEPYEALGMRGEEFYRELLPLLLRTVQESGRQLIIKLHPFESRAQRRRLVRSILGPDKANLVSVVDGPLTSSLLAQVWCGITVESTTVMDCRQNGICCFLCGWITMSAFEYAQQFARFGIGEVLDNVEQVREIPARLAEFYSRPAPSETLASPADPAILQRWLTCGFHEPSSVRSAS